MSAEPPIWRQESNRISYVGWASNLNARVRSHSVSSKMDSQGAAVSAYPYRNVQSKAEAIAREKELNQVKGELSSMKLYLNISKARSRW
jgi:predicted GIY-YIG superfamily endonuclease